MEKIKLFISHSHRDEYYKEELLKHLSSLQRSTNIEISSDQLPGNDVDLRKQTLKELHSADIIILLISADFLASDFAYDTELPYILRQGRLEYSRIIPIIIRECNWQSSEIAEFQVLPPNGKAIASYENFDKGWVHVIEKLKYVVLEYQKNKTIIVGDYNRIISKIPEAPIKTIKNKNYHVNDVFPLNGTPVVNFVEPLSFKKLTSSIKHKGRGLIIEGPSGIGKTTALKKSIEKIGLDEENFTYLTARNPQHIDRIINIQNNHKGVIAIDDFHRLDEKLQCFISDYLKFLADTESSIKKLIIIGIPNTGNKLIGFGYDLATRIDIFELSKVPNDKIEELITKGEAALNIIFAKKSELISAANGSLNIAQFLCHYSSVGQEIYERAEQTTFVDTDFIQIVSDVKHVLKPKFENFIFLFSQIGGFKDRTCIKLLLELSNKDNGAINLLRLSETNPDLANGIKIILKEDLIGDLLESKPICKSFIYYDGYTKDLVIDDPQLLFYLNYTPESVLASLTGKQTIATKDKVFISYSHKDSDFADRVIVHLTPLFRDGIIDPWSDKRIKPGEKWNKEIEKALEGSKIAILLISADFLASEYINEKELPKLIKSSSEMGTIIIPLFLKPANLNRFGNVTQYQGVNTPSNTIIEMSESEQEKQFVSLSQRVEECYQYN